MPTRAKPGAKTKKKKEESASRPDQSQEQIRGQKSSHGSRDEMQKSNPDKHGGSGTGRQQGGSGSARER